MTSYKDLLAQRNELDKQIETMRAQEVDAAITQIRELMQQYGITAQAIMPSQGPDRGVRVQVDPKYRDPAIGKECTGRGRSPTWIAGKDREQFRIVETS